MSNTKYRTPLPEENKNDSFFLSGIKKTDTAKSASKLVKLEKNTEIITFKPRITGKGWLKRFLRREKDV